MPLPTSATWNLADFNPATIGSLLGLDGTLVSISPSVSPYFSYNDTFTILKMASSNGTLATLDLTSPIPAQYTVEIVARFRDLPHNFGDVAQRRVGLTVADDDGRGISIYFSKAGVAIARIDDLGSVTALENTASTTAEISGEFRTIRVAVDSGLGRAYVFFGDDSGVPPTVRFIIPVAATPLSVVDTFQLFVRGRPDEAAAIDIKALRLAAGLVLPDVPPVANAGGDRVTSVGQAVRFDGRASYDAENAPLSYHWRLVDAPLNSEAASEIGSGSTVDDGDGDGLTDLITVPAGSIPAWATSGTIIQFGGVRGVVASVDNLLGEIVATTAVFPDDRLVEPVRLIRQVLVEADTETPYLVPDVAGLFRVELVVNDGVSDSEPSEVVVSVRAARAPFGVEPDVSPLWRAIGDEWSLVENRGLFEEMWKGTAQIVAAKLLELWQYNYNFSIRDVQRVFQRKWVPFRTMLNEPDPSSSSFELRFGGLVSGVEFESGVPVVGGSTLVVTVWGGVDDLEIINVPLSGSTLTQIAASINSVTAAYQVYAVPYAPRLRSGITYHGNTGTTVDDGDGDGFTSTISFAPSSLPSWVSAGDALSIAGIYGTIQTVNNAGGWLTLTAEIVPDALSGQRFHIHRTCRLVLRGTRGFQVQTSTGATLLELPTGRYNHLEGDEGALVTDRSYYVGNGFDLAAMGVEKGDLLVLNNGQAFEIEKVFSAEDDPYENQRLLLVDPLPADATETWSIPSIVRSDQLDFGLSAIYPGDLVKIECFNAATSGSIDALGTVVATKGQQLAAHLDGFYEIAAGGNAWESLFVGVRRRKAIPIDPDIVSIPRLQDEIPVSNTPTIYSEIEHYVLEPFYRDIDGAHTPVLQFRDSTWIDPDLEPPDILWAELVLFSNEGNVENLFGQLVGFLRDDASVYSRDFNYVAGVAGLMYAQQHGAAVDPIQIGAQILLGQAFAEASGVIEEIRNDFSPTHGRLLIRDDDGNTPSQSETVRTYYYRKLELDTSATSGLAVNRATNLPWAVGDHVPQFAPIGAGVEIVDLKVDSRWYVPYVRGGVLNELEKYHHFLVTFDLDLVQLANLELFLQFLSKTKPVHTKPLVVGLRDHEEDLDVTDDLQTDVLVELFDSPCGSPYAYMYDDYRGDGTIWSEHDDGVTYYDARDDCPLDLIVFEIEVDWAGGVPTYDAGFISDVPITDVTGAHTGTPGSTFFLLYDTTIAAGTYRMTLTIKSAGVVLP